MCNLSGGRRIVNCRGVCLTEESIHIERNLSSASVCIRADTSHAIEKKCTKTNKNGAKYVLVPYSLLFESLVECLLVCLKEGDRLVRNWVTSNTFPVTRCLQPLLTRISWKEDAEVLATLQWKCALIGWVNCLASIAESVLRWESSWALRQLSHPLPQNHARPKVCCGLATESLKLSPSNWTTGLSYDWFRQSTKMAIVCPAPTNNK